MIISTFTIKTICDGKKIIPLDYLLLAIMLSLKLSLCIENNSMGSLSDKAQNAQNRRGKKYEFEFERRDYLRRLRHIHAECFAYAHISNQNVIKRHLFILLERERDRKCIFINIKL